MGTPGRRHKWDRGRERRMAADAYADGCARNIRVCAICQIQRVTVIPPQTPPWPWHEWITPDGNIIRSETTPPCSAVSLRAVA